MLIGSLAMLFITNANLATMVLLTAPVVIGPIIFMGRRVRRLSRTSQDRLAGSGAIAGESLWAIQTVQAFTHEEYDQARFSGAVEDVFRTAIRRITMRSAMTVVAIFFVIAGIVGVLWSGARAVSGGSISGGELVQFMLYAVFMAASVGALSEVWGDMTRAAGATERLVELLHVKPEITAVQRNEDIVDRKSVGKTVLMDGDSVELVRIVGGG